MKLYYIIFLFSTFNFHTIAQVRFSFFPNQHKQDTYNIISTCLYDEYDKENKDYELIGYDEFNKYCCNLFMFPNFVDIYCGTTDSTFSTNLRGYLYLDVRSYEYIIVQSMEWLKSNQLDTSELKKHNVKLGKPNINYANSHLWVDYFKNSKKSLLYISPPLFSLNHKFAIISYSVLNTFSHGYHVLFIYKKDNDGKWRMAKKIEI